MGDSVEFLLLRGGGDGGGAKHDGVDFLDCVEEGLGGFSAWGGSGEDLFEIFFGIENVIDCETAAVIFHSGWVDVDERENVFDGPAFPVLVFGYEVGDFNS